MKNIFFFLLSAMISGTSFSQFVARAEIKEDIPGICDKKNVFTLLAMLEGQKEAVAAVKDAAIEKMLSDSVVYLKDKADYNDKGMVSIIINCKGDVVKCEIDNKTKSPELDEQVVKVFKTVTFTKPGKLNGKSVDSLRLWSFEIKNGKITIN